MREFSDNDFTLGMQSGYREAMEFTDCHCDNPELQNADFSDELLSQADKDCEEFFHANKKLLRESGLHPDQCGHDFWLTRNAAGVQNFRKWIYTLATMEKFTVNNPQHEKENTK